MTDYRSSPEVDKARRDIDEAVRNWAAIVDDDVMITGWVLSGTGMRISLADDPEAATTYMTCRAPGVQFHAALGLYYNAIYNLTHQEEDD